MRNFTKQPAPPTGDDKISVWARLYQQYVSQYLPKDILGANWKPDANGGGSYVLPKISSPKPPVIPPVIFPFKIYQINNVTDNTLSARTVQVRGGTVGFRSAYFLDTLRGSTIGNFEEPFHIDLDFSAIIDDPQIPNTGGNITLANTVDTLLIDVGEFPVDFPQIVLNPDRDFLGSILASLWIVCIDDPDVGVGFQLWGRMWAENATDPTGRPTQAFPIGPQIIPIGTMDANPDFGGLTEGIFQYQTGNLVNRYAPPALSSGVTSPLYMRGRWDLDSLSGQVFYDGDMVVDDTIADYTNPADSQKFYTVFAYIGGTNIETNSPLNNPDGPKWKRISVITKLADQ